MKVIADICIVPIGVGVSVSKYIAVCEGILKDAGLNPRLHGYGTNVEGEWHDVFNAMKECHEEIHKMGAPRISTNLRLGTRVDREQTIEDKLKSVEKKLKTEE
ncbi:MAG: MTH1187 family thiamine-binding protein [Candidatus Eisenbacteria bacterium]|uniref:MTH1187 family thiamine-binding protein n=1 Tax=Eiseniibacteriota bacterium TaxID=2212470 RepID=A0A948WE35_UNCEI|nr:MTH1187 family thiamine-binding protein [Candidatus Eisenbacteria bacterium]MBU1950842.1 MTH1187 family thiamine-binding protein [Candidatus Eisenbacteria bacterium]MBU2692408.1 MTH1187 family thiamine-binding protein [Candidatus Eisenbacteria bacterium]